MPYQQSSITAQQYRHYMVYILIKNLMSQQSTSQPISDALDKVNRIIGNITSWSCLVMAIIATILVIARNLNNWGNIAAQESLLYFHSVMFLLCLSYAALNDGHVRVDIFYQRFQATHRAWVDIFGNIIFLMPFALFLLFTSWPYAQQSWTILEGSSSANGLDLVYILKSFIPISAILLCVHVISDTLKKLMLVIKPQMSTSK